MTTWQMWPKDPPPPEWLRDLMRDAYAVAVAPTPRLGIIPRVAYWPPGAFRVLWGPLDLGLPSALDRWERSLIVDRLGDLGPGEWLYVGPGTVEP